MRDRTVEDTFYISFTTRAFATGIPTVLAGTPVVSAYEDASLTQITAGITLGVDHDSVVGLNMLTIVATGANGYESGKDYNLVITTGTVGGVSVVGEVVGQFSLGLSAAAVDLANGTDGLGAIKTDTAAVLVDTGTTLDAALAVVDANVDAILVDTSTTLDAALAVVDANVDAILVDTGTTLDAALAVVDANVDQIETAVITNAAGVDIAADIIAVKAETATILVDTGTTLDAALAVVDANVDAILVDTGTTLDAALAVVDANVDQIETAVITNAAGVDIAADIIAVKAETATILVDTGTTLDAALAVVDANVDAILVDTGTTLDAALAVVDANVDQIETAVITNAAGTDIAADIIAVKAETASLQVDTDDIQTRLLTTAQVATQVQGLTAIEEGAAIAGTLSTTQMTTDLTEATDDHYNGRTIVWTSGVLLRQATDVTDYTGATKLLTYTATTEAPSATDTFILV